METDDSTNKPFSGLTAFLEENKIKLRKDPTPQKKQKSAEDDEHLLVEAMRDVRVIRQETKRIRVKKELRPAGHNQESAEDLLSQTILADSKTINVTNMPEYMEGYQEGINPLVMQKLRSGEFAVQQVIDLHGLSIENARDTFEYFLSEAIRRGLKCVKIIHGRGLKSKRDPTIKDYLKTWIVRAMHRKWVTALLTIAGYSLQDTVVVFDRIRENTAKMKSRDDFGNIINVSINEVLSRTIVTGITTLISLAAIMIVGGEVLFDFAFALFLGLIVGTYSSIFVASPIVYVWRRKFR